MQTFKNEGPISARTVSAFDHFTGGKKDKTSKTADFAIYYNMARDNIKELITEFEASQKDISKAEFFRTETFIALRNYLWKGFEFNRNKSGYSLTEDDKWLVRKLLSKLNDLRNFHSHIWHDSAVLEFDTELEEFMTEKLNVALSLAREKFSGDDTSFFEKQLEEFGHFRIDKGKKFITQEGRCFFLSFFLSKGQMNSFLQQRRGSKRNDLPVYKVKRYVYTYYCHNDGASILGHHINKAAFDELSTKEKNEMLKARQYYKIVSYLNDIPEVLANPLAVPLFINRNEAIKRCESVTDLADFCRERKIFTPVSFIEIDKNNPNNKEAVEDSFQGIIEFVHSEVKGYTFRISRSHLHQMIIQRLLKGESFEAVFLNKLKTFAKDRFKLYQFLVGQYNAENAVPTMTEEDLKGYLIRGGTKLQNSYTLWLDSWTKEKTISSTARWNLINKLRSSDQPPVKQLKTSRGKGITYEPALPEPIVLLSQYFFMGEENFTEDITNNNIIPRIRLQQKPRAENNFVHYAIHFLVDMGLVPEWKWQVETFIIEEETDPQTWEIKLVNKRKTKFSAGIPEGYRLSITNNQVVVAIRKDGATGDEKADHWIFGLGSNAIRYLIAGHVLSGSNIGKLKGFLQQMKADMKKLIDYSMDSRIETAGYSLLEDQYIPAFYHNLRRRIVTKSINNGQHEQALKALKEKVKDRVRYIAEELEAATKSHSLRRAQKNRVIMRCYTFFDWSNTRDKKFLRQNEYNEMSICHYMLDDRRKFNELYKTTFGLQRRVPREVNELLYNSNSLDELLVNTKEKTIAYLQSRMENIIGITVTKVLKQELIPFAKMIGLNVDDNLLSPANSELLHQARRHTMDILPFDIHPNLVLKFFYPEKYKNGHFKYNSLYKELHTYELKKGLYTDHYAIDTLRDLYKQYEGIPPKAESTGRKNEAEQAIQKLIGAMNTCLTEDILLWWVARQYLQGSSYTSQRAEDILKCLQADNNNATVKNLHTEIVVMPISKPNCPDYYLQIRMHQLDDLLFQTNQQKLHDAITHYCNRQEEEGKEYHKPVSKDTPIGLDEVYREIQRVQRDALIMGNLLLDWERTVITEYCNVQGADTDIKKQELLKRTAIEVGNEWRKRENLLPVNNATYLNFWIVLRLAKDTGILDETILSSKVVNEIRKDVLHSKIPVDGSFKKKTMMKAGGDTTALADLLHIHEPIDAKNDRSKYEEKKEG